MGWEMANENQNAGVSSSTSYAPADGMETTEEPNNKKQKKAKKKHGCLFKILVLIIILAVVIVGAAYLNDMQNQKAREALRESAAATKTVQTATDESNQEDESAAAKQADQTTETEQAAESQQSGETSDTPIADAVSDATSDVVSADFKEFVDGYESFMNEYCDFMVKYASAQSSNDTAALATMLADYTSLVQQEAEWIDKMNAVDTGSLSAADSAYYLAATARIEKRLADIGLSNS